jgi:ribonuclease PH
MSTRMTPREIKITPSINPYAAGSVLVEFGMTKVHVTASVDESVPRFLRGKNQGWVTAEYSMLPGSTHSRSNRERNKVSGRTQEIQRLIGRSLRSVVDLKKLGERSVTLDCDVLVADGGTRTASITGAQVALILAVKSLMEKGLLKEDPIGEHLAAISVGLSKDKEVIADLDYSEDSTCHTDMNIVMTKSKKIVELQGTGEEGPFSLEELDQLVSCAQNALETVFTEMDRVLNEL